ncbi:2-phospho-L-lactate guanylyltransferase [Granulicoccus sp. GXG6511]|uniref:2-phospho-L-lactate guanylyltransferase n=1 Tax=Granulicoccus sp. GXG6511 TaxID=3381351 RepID=UPI003D7D5975
MACPADDPRVAPTPPGRAGVVIAVKDLSRAKSRMTALSAAHRGRLAALMAVAVARAWSEVLDVVAVVTTAPGIGPLLGAHGVDVRVVPDPRSGLDAAFEAGERVLRAEGCALVVAAMADLPALTAVDLRSTMAGCTGAGRWFVRDDMGTGTTLLAAHGMALSPEFGRDSAARHEASGAVELAAAPGVRLDADNPTDLVRAIPLGVQDPVTLLMDGAALAEHTTGTVVGRSGAGWELVLASGSRGYAAAGALGPELRRLAPGQRLHLVRDSGGAVRHAWI